ncbi:MAG: glycosyltransferase [Acetobacteraceae bacterium]|nr:glycosyltransferase [Acetobacteraceae bacterium]
MNAPPATSIAVSVVIPCKNRTAMLRDCMRGLARQDLGLDRFEVVLVDNCSTEDLGVVADEARALGLNLRLARTPQDRGPAPARNLGVSLASAPIIAFTDSDCRPTAPWLRTALAHFADPAIAFVGGPVLAKPEQQVTLTSRITFVTPAEHPTFPTANLLMRRDLFLSHGGFDTALSFVDPWDRTTECADTDLAWRMLKSGCARSFEPRAIVEHEVETQGLLMWFCDPSRLFVLPELLRRHPELRRELLTFNLFFYFPAALLYLLLPALAVIAWYYPAALLLLPVVLLLRAIQRTRSLNPSKVGAQMVHTLAHIPRMLVMNATLIYGSIRFRNLVL